MGDEQEKVEEHIEEGVSSEVGQTPKPRRKKPGAGWHGDPEGHAAAGRKGGETVSRNREHMADIGRKGGEARKQEIGPGGYTALGKKGGEKVSKDRDHMAKIGRKGGLS